MLYTDIDADVDIWPETTGVGVPWTPADLGASITNWWNADDHGTALMVDDGAGLISSWKDRVANINPTATTTARPTWGATSFNGTKAGVTGDGVANQLKTTTFSGGSPPVGTTPGEIWILANTTSLTDNAAYLHYGATSGTSRNVNHDATSRIRVTDGAIALISALPLLSGNCVIGAQFNLTNHTARINGIVTSVPVSGATTLNTPSTGTLSLFAYNNSAIFNACTMRHVIVTTLLTIGQRVRLEGWLAWDGGIQANLALGHPYRNSPPTTAWTPYDLDGTLAAWFSGDDHGTINMTDDGAGLISNWRDRALGTTNLAGATTARPTWTATPFNSVYQGLTYNGTTNNLGLITVPAAIPQGATPGCLVAVISQDRLGTSGNIERIFGYGGDGNNARSISRSAVSTINRLNAVDEVGGLVDTVTDFSGASIVSTEWSGTTVSAWLNGTPTTPASATISTLATSNVAMRIGARQSAATLVSKIVGRHFFITTAMTPFQRQQLEGWTAWDSGLTAKLPVSHPFKAAAPVRDWRPTDLGPALKAWWNADDHGTARMVDDGAGLISSWTDRVSGLAVTGTTTARPTWAAASFNSAYAGLTFDGANTSLRTTTFTSVVPVGATAGNIIGLASQTTGGATGGQPHLLGYGGDGANARALARIGIGSVNRLFLTTEAASLIDTIVNFTGNHISVGEWAGTTQSGWLDGTAITPPSGTIATLATTGGGLCIGGRQLTPTAGLYWFGVIRHVFVTTQLTTLQRQQLEGWLAWDSGLTSVLPAGHPYKSVRP